ncbi:MAG TPA: hypothetical protein VEC60_00830 [Reyranella sp.]|nr:hypothetical protein [Reyranella sp.]
MARFFHDTCISFAQHFVLAAGLVLAGPSLSAAQSQCELVAERAQVADLRSAVGSRWSFLDALSAVPGVAAVGNAESHGTVGSVEAYARATYRISPPLSAAFAKVASYGTGWSADLYRFGEGASSLRMVESSQGTAHCQVLIFFDVAADGSAHAIAAPPSADGLCSTVAGRAGEIDGTPTFIVEDQRLPEIDVAISLTAWQRGAWQRTCRIGFKFKAVFRVDDRSCHGVDCDRIETEVLRQVERVDRKAPEETNDPRVDRAAFNRMKALATDYASKFLPGLPRDKPSLFYSSFLEFRDATFVPIVVDAETYLGQIGHGAFGWRTAADYLFAAYRLENNRLEPVAAFYVSKVRGELLDVAVEQ